MSDDRPLCFIVGPIGETGSLERKLADLIRGLIIDPVATAAGYQTKRADNDASPGSISAAVINDVFDADLVIADLTGFNPNAFYELGIRHSTGKPTIHMIAESRRLPFDNLDQRTIFVDTGDFANIQAAQALLKSAIELVQATDYKATNPVTQARGGAVLAASSDTGEQIIADLADRLGRLESEVERVQETRSISAMPPDGWSPRLRTRTPTLADALAAQGWERSAGDKIIPFSYLDDEQRSKALEAMVHDLRSQRREQDSQRVTAEKLRAILSGEDGQEEKE